MSSQEGPVETLTPPPAPKIQPLPCPDRGPFTCCICDSETEGQWGCNPWPICDATEKCCDECDKEIVLLARMLFMQGQALFCDQAYKPEAKKKNKEDQA